MPADLMGQIRNLPHLTLDGATYFVTWRTVDDEALNDSERQIVLNALAHWDGDRCTTYLATVMPDHVHWIVRPHGDHKLSDLVAGVKKYSSRIIHEHRGQTGRFWQDERFDHIVRDHLWFREFVRYCLWNPVEAGLCERPSQYPWQYIHDQIQSAGQPLNGENDSSESCPTKLSVFTTRPDTLFGATYMVVAPEHPLVEQILANPQPETDADAVRAYVDEAKNRSDVERMENKDKTGVFTGVYAVNPVNDERIPVWVADYVLMGYGTGAIMAVPAQDERDWAFAETFDLPIVRTVQPPDGFDGKAYVGRG